MSSFSRGRKDNDDWHEIFAPHRPIVPVLSASIALRLDRQQKSILRTLEELKRKMPTRLLDGDERRFVYCTGPRIAHQLARILTAATNESPPRESQLREEVTRVILPTFDLGDIEDALM